MKKQITIILLALIPSFIFAQNPKEEFRQKINGKDKKVAIISGAFELEVEGTDGTDVIITSVKMEQEKIPEAEGLKLLTPGLSDNTGVGASANIEGNVMVIKVPKSKYFERFKILVPRNLDISVTESGNPYAHWEISNMTGEVETNTSYSKLEIEDVSGPIVAHAGYGKVFIVYNKLNAERPNFISSSGPIDVTLPADSKATLKLQSNYADVFTDFDITQTPIPNTDENDEDCDCNSSENLKRFSKNDNVSSTFGTSEKTSTESKQSNTESFSIVGNSTTTASSFPRTRSISRGGNWRNKNTTYGTINDGGVQITIMSTNGNIFLRKKK